MVHLQMFAKCTVKELFNTVYRSKHKSEIAKYNQRYKKRKQK